MTLENSRREFFVKLSNEGDSNELYLIQHNADCHPGCSSWYNCGGVECQLCHKANYSCPSCSPVFYTSYICN